MVDVLQGPHARTCEPPDAGSRFSSESETSASLRKGCMPAVETLSQEMMEFGKECRIVTDPHSGRGGWRAVEGVGGGCQRPLGAV